MGWVCADLLNNVLKLGVQVKYGVNATKERIDTYDSDIVITATGGSAVYPKAFHAENVSTVTEILDGSVKLENKKVAVIGSGMTGLETSELLIEQGNKVVIVEMSDMIAPGAWFQHVDDAMPKLKAGGTEFLPGHKLLSVGEKGIILERTKDNTKVEIDVDYVVLSMGVRPETDLFNEIKDSKSYKAYNIGDSVKIGRIANASESAYQLVMRI